METPIQKNFMLLLMEKKESYYSYNPIEKWSMDNRGRADC